MDGIFNFYYIFFYRFEANVEMKMIDFERKGIYFTLENLFRVNKFR